MKLYVGITNRDWFYFLRARNASEMNFWHPRATTGFNIIKPGEAFLFKLKYPENRIVGGAFLVRHTVLPMNLAWEVFAEANGCTSFEAFQERLATMRGDSEKNPQIGCTVLTDPFYLSDAESWPAPADWKLSIQTGKSYDVSYGEGARLFELAKQAILLKRDVGEAALREEPPRYGLEHLIKPRLGQGGFRVEVLEGYQRRCAITGERTLPVLDAAHIQPYAQLGPHELPNGMLLRSDWHTLFDAGYVTVTNDLRIEVSRRIKEEFSNGRDYYAFHGQPLKILPEESSQRPSKKYLEWHQANRFLS